MAPAHWTIVREILSRQIPEREIWAFGSRARGNAKPYSDLDLAILGEHPLTTAQACASAGAFEESDLPWRVDIVDWSTTDESFRRIILRDEVVIQRPATKSEQCL